MRKLTLAALLIGVTFVAGCKHSGSRKLTGQWRGLKADGVPAALQASANEFAKGSELVAQGNQVAITTPTSQPGFATYTVDKEDATTLEIHTDRDNTIEKFGFDDNGATLVWKVDAKKSLTFKKVK